MKLTQEQKDQVLNHIIAAAHCRAAQWEQEREVEKILGHEVDISELIADLAVIVDEPAVTVISTGPSSTLTFEEIEEHLTEA